MATSSQPSRWPRSCAAAGIEAVFIGTRRGIEARLVPNAGFPIEWIEIGGFNQVGLLTTSAHAVAATSQCADGAPTPRPPSSASCLQYGWLCCRARRPRRDLARIPVVVMEPNAVPGLTNRQFARFTLASVSKLS